MKTVTYEEFIKFKPCWLETPNGRRRLQYYAQKHERWSAFDILNLNRVSARDRLWAVLREELIDAPILHEFACRCAEMAMEMVPDPDSRSIAAIDAKRRWIRGEISDNELHVVMDAARDAAMVAAWDAARVAAMDAARDAAWDAARDAAMDKQIEMLRHLIGGQKDEEV